MFISSSKVAALIVTLTFCTTAAGAQGVQNWLTNQESQVRQDLSTGTINANQASQLAGREAQIQAQEQQYAAQNGGTLTPQESRQVAREMQGVNQGLARDMRSNYPVSNGMGMYGAPTGYYPPGSMGYYPQAGYLNNNFAYPPNITGNGMYNGAYSINNNGVYGVNGYGTGRYYRRWGNGY